MIFCSAVPGFLAFLYLLLVLISELWGLDEILRVMTAYAFGILFVLIFVYDYVLIDCSQVEKLMFTFLQFVSWESFRVWCLIPMAWLSSVSLLCSFLDKNMFWIHLGTSISPQYSGSLKIHKVILHQGSLGTGVLIATGLAIFLGLSMEENTVVCFFKLILIHIMISFCYF